MDTEPYACYAPELIIEVSNETTIKPDLTDKLVAYQKIPGLQYYLLAEPEEIHVVVFTKDSEGGWLSEIFTAKENKIALHKLDAVLNLSDIYSHL